MARTRYKTNFYASHLSAVAGTVTTLETNTLTINTGVTMPANVIIISDSATAGLASGHLDGSFCNLVFSAAGAGEVCVHGLGQAAVGWKIVGQNSSQIIYCSDFSATATNVTFSATSAGNAKLFIF